jgi:hypothetical protein
MVLKLFHGTCKDESSLLINRKPKTENPKKSPANHGLPGFADRIKG